MRPWGSTACDGEVEGKVHEEVKAEELADDAGSGGRIGAAAGAVQGPAKLRRPGPSQGASCSLIPVPVIPCSSLQTLCLLAPTGHL